MLVCIKFSVKNTSVAIWFKSVRKGTEIIHFFKGRLFSGCKQINCENNRLFLWGKLDVSAQFYPPLNPLKGT